MRSGFMQLSARSRFAATSLLCVCAGVLAWQTLVGPERDGLAIRRAKFAAMLGELARARATAATLPGLLREVDALDRSLRNATAMLQDGKDPQDVLRSLHDLAGESSLDLTRFAPKAAETKPEVVAWPIELGLEGGYHDLGRFFGRIATAPRLMTVTKLDVKVIAGSKSDGRLSAVCVATAFMLRKDLVSPAPPGGQP